MTMETKQLVDAARQHRLTPGEKEAQRQSFAYGNTKIDNPRITREIVSRQAENISVAASTEKT